MKKIERREIQVGQYTMYYQVTGEGEPLVLVHGLSGSLRWWRRNVPALAEHYRVYLIDLPGFGMMRHFPRRWTLDEVADGLVTWIKAVGLQKVSLVAHSMGGYICIRVAATRPEVVDRLVLVSPAGIPKFRSVLGYTIPLIVAIRYLTPRFFPVLAYDALRAGPLTLLRAAQDLLTKDIRDYLKAIQAPTLLIWGVNDSLVPPVLGDVLQQEIAHAHLFLLKKAGHVGMFDQPEEFNAAVLAFLRGEEVGR
jgi:pimeloyl-ACP methyl ester carboxylesterase